MSRIPQEARLACLRLAVDCAMVSIPHMYARTADLGAETTKLIVDRARAYADFALGTGGAEVIAAAHELSKKAA
jgi:hypothetical protein